MTLFGGTSPLGSTLGGLLTRMGSTAIYPYRHNASLWDNRFKELKTTADLGYKTYMKLTDFTSEKECGYAVRDSNVVISCIGSTLECLSLSLKPPRQAQTKARWRGSSISQLLVQTLILTAEDWGLNGSESKRLKTSIPELQSSDLHTCLTSCTRTRLLLANGWCKWRCSIAWIGQSMA